MEVVGQVAHVKNYGVDEESRVELYLPFLQNTGSGFTLVVRTDNAPGVAAAGLRTAMRAASPDIPLYQVRALDELVAERSAERRLAAQLIGVFATVALVLAAVGIYGVMSYAVAQRTQEIGIRMALGAGQENILQMVMRNGAALALAGVAIGLLAAFLLARLISSLLFQTSAADPPTFSIVPLLLLAVALARELSARRGARRASTRWSRCATSEPAAPVPARALLRALRVHARATCSRAPTARRCRSPSCSSWPTIGIAPPGTA